MGLEQWVLENATLRLIKGSTHQVRETDTCSTHESFPQEPAARYFPPAESTQRPLGRFDAPQTPGDSSSAGGLATSCTSGCNDITFRFNLMTLPKWVLFFIFSRARFLVGLSNGVFCDIRFFFQKHHQVFRLDRTFRFYRQIQRYGVSAVSDYPAAVYFHSLLCQQSLDPADRKG